MWPWRVKMAAQNLLRLLLLLIMMMRIVLATVCCRFGSWGLVIKLNFCSDFEHKSCSRLWSWSSGEILKLKIVWHWNLIKNCVRTCDMNSTLESVVPLAMFYAFSQLWKHQERFMALVHSCNCCFFGRLCHQGKTFRAEKILLDQLYAEVR